MTTAITPAALDTETVRAILAAHADTLREQYGVAALLLFGSTVRGEARPDSDVDLLVEFNRPTGYFVFFNLQEYLQRILERDVDLGTVPSLRPHVRTEVEEEMLRVL